MDFKESWGSYAVRYWLLDLNKDDPTSSEIRTRIFVALERSGIKPSIPAQKVFMAIEGRSRKEQKRREEIDRRVEALRQVRIFEPLNDQERHTLAEQLGVAPFRRGEIITRQGMEAHHLYMMVRGQAEEYVTAEGAAPSPLPGKRVALLNPGDVFGEMGLMTGEVRQATVVAISDVLCYRLDKSVFEETLRRRPQVAEAMSQLLVQRKADLDAMVASANAEARQHRPPPVASDLLKRIKQFFSLS
jgi:CRP-like cAMP-binding protein